MVSLWLPSFATDRLRRLAKAGNAAGWKSRPLATVTAGHGGLRIAAADRVAAAGGVAPGLPLADARALLPSLRAADADPAGDRRALDGLADWCGRYTPWTAADEGGSGIWLDVTGAAHLFGGEPALLRDLVARFAGLGFAAAAAVADTPGAAWAAARFAAKDPDGIAVVPASGLVAALAPLPAAGLRLPAATVEGLARMGLRSIGQLVDLPRAPLVRRFGEVVVKRLDQALGRVREPLSPRRPAAPFVARIAFAEPVVSADVVARATRRLLRGLCAQLAAAHRGARRLELALYRVDGTLARAAVGTSRPTRAPDHLERLFREKLAGLDAGFGVEAMALHAVETAPLPPTQMAADASRRADGEAVAELLDRLANRLGAGHVVGLAPVASHIPERACREAPPLAKGPAAPLPARPRPLHLLPWPEPIEAVAPVPDHPPVMFRWRRRRHRVVRADGPERILPEWWRESGELDAGDAGLRDYYRIEDAGGGRFWVFREGPYRPDRPPRWYLHGFFP